MSTLSQIVDVVRRDLQSGINADESKLDDLYLERKIHQARAIIIQTFISKGRDYINDAWLQELDIDQVERDLDCGAVDFECPTVISTDSQIDGFVYVGHINGIKPFIRHRGSYSGLTMHSVFRSRIKKDITWEFLVTLQNRSLIRCFGNPKLEKIKVQAIFNDPTEVPGYRKDTDRYPVDSTVERELIELVTTSLFSKLRMPADLISNSQDKPQLK